jgi:predicted dehydrogenase
LNPSNIAILGCGAVTLELHVPALIELERRGVLAVTALFDPDRAGLQAAAALFPAARELKSLAELGESGCDVALVASPARFHAEQAIACLAAGLAVLCEKPMATSIREADAMVQAAKTHGRPLAVGQVRRFFPTTQTIKGVIDNQRLGRLLSFQVREGGNFRWPARSAQFFQKKSAGGGVLLDTGIHTLDLLLWWLGEPKSFSYEDDAMGGIEINCRLKMDYGTCRGNVQLTSDCEIPTGFHLDFEQGWIAWQPYAASDIEIGFTGSDQALRGQLQPAPISNGRTLSAGAALSMHDGFVRQWLNVIAAAQGREILRVPGEEAIRGLAFIEKCYASRAFMAPPWFTDRENDRALALNRESPA